MEKLLFLLLLLFLPLGAMSQDERYFRQIFKADVPQVPNAVVEKKYSYFIHTPFYALDINHDQIPEEIVFVKKDSEDWIEIYSFDLGEKKKILEYRFETKGFESELYKIEFKRLSAKNSVLLLYYFEGVSRYIELQSTSRIYAITIDNDDLKTLKVFKGPSLFEESRSFKGHYHLRNYQVYLQDLNNDGTKELVVKFRDYSRVYVYTGEGKWKTFN